MLYEVLVVVLRVLGAVVAAAVLFLGFVFLIFLGDANGRGRVLLSRGLDRFATIVVYLAWFGLLWWIGFSQVTFMVACGVAVVLSLIYAASYHAASPPDAGA